MERGTNGAGVRSGVAPVASLAAMLASKRTNGATTNGATATNGVGKAPAPPRWVHAEMLSQRDTREKQMLAYKKASSDLARLREQFSTVKRENDVLRQVKDHLAKRLSEEERRSAQLQKDLRRRSRGSSAGSGIRPASPTKSAALSHAAALEKEVKDLKMRLAIAEAEREAAQAHRDVVGRFEEKFFLSWDETRELRFRWIRLLWYWSLAERLGLCPSAAPANAKFWQRKLTRTPLGAPERITLGAVADLLSPGPAAAEDEARAETGASAGGGPGSSAGGGPSAPGRGERHTLHEMLQAETSLRALHAMRLDAEVHAALMERARPALLPALGRLNEQGPQRAGRTLATVALFPPSPSSSSEVGEGEGGRGAHAKAMASPHSKLPGGGLVFTQDVVAGAQLDRLWLGYVWGRAAACGVVEPHIAPRRHRLWAARAAGGTLSPTDLVDVEDAMREVLELQLEAQILAHRSRLAPQEPQRG